MFNEVQNIHVTQEELQNQFDAIMNSIDQNTNSIWIIDNKVALIPWSIYERTIKQINIQNEINYK